MDYFVSYRFPNGFGRCLINRSTPICSIGDIVDMEKAILDGKILKGELNNEETRPVIVSWQKFEVPNKHENIH